MYFLRFAICFSPVEVVVPALKQGLEDIGGATTNTPKKLPHLSLLLTPCFLLSGESPPL